MSYSSLISLKTKLNILNVWFYAKVAPAYFDPLFCEIHHVNHPVYIDLLLLYQGRESFIQSFAFYYFPL